MEKVMSFPYHLFEPIKHLRFHSTVKEKAMPHRSRTILFSAPFFLALQLILTVLGAAQTYQTDFPVEEFKARREKLLQKIGIDALALIQGAQAGEGSEVFRQSNEFYYFCGLETPRAYLAFDGRSKKTTLYLPHRDEARERGEGKVLSAEDADLVKQLTGVDRVAATELLARDWQWTLYWTAKAPALYTPFSPAEGPARTRDMMQAYRADVIADPWDGRPSREGHFVQLLRTRFPEFEIRNLSPIIDTLRNVKSPLEIRLLRRAANLASLGLMAAMRSTRPNVMEYQIGAVAQYIFLINGSQGDAYHSIVAGGTNSTMGHYFHNNNKLKDGDLVLMDYAPDYKYYASDVTRMWPVNGTFSPGQRQLCSFIQKVHDALLNRIRPGVTGGQIMDEATEELKALVEKTRWLKPYYKTAAEKTIRQRNIFSHPVGMAVHDVGNYLPRPLEPGEVFSLDPGINIPEENIIVRIENVLVVTKDGVENLSALVPADPDAIEKVMREQGMLQTFPPQNEKE
jgi:Xaa-Pro aminopeptidase